MKKKSIVSFYPGNLNVVRGTPIRVRSVLKNLASYEDIEITVLSYDNKPPIPGISHIQIPSGKWKKINTLLAYIKNNKTDLVIGHTIIAGFELLCVSLFSGCRTMLEMHGFAEEQTMIANKIGWLKYCRDKLLYRFYYRSVSSIVTTSKSAMRVLSRFHKNVIAVVDSCDTGRFNPDVQATYAIADSPEKLIIGYAGNTRAWQGLDFLLEAFKIIHEKDSNFQLALLLSEDLSVSAPEGVSVYGRIPNEEVPGFLASCDILVMPRSKDQISFPSKIIEYMAMEKAVVASNVSDVPEIITPMENGLIHEPGDIEAFISCIFALKDPKLRKELGKEARKRILMEFTTTAQIAILHEHILKEAS